MEQDKLKDKTPAEANQPHEAAAQINEKTPAAEEDQPQEQCGAESNTIPERKRPVLKSGKVMQSYIIICKAYILYLV